MEAHKPKRLRLLEGYKLLEAEQNPESISLAGLTSFIRSNIGEHNTSQWSFIISLNLIKSLPSFFRVTLALCMWEGIYGYICMFVYMHVCTHVLVEVEVRGQPWVRFLPHYLLYSLSQVSWWPGTHQGGSAAWTVIRRNPPDSIYTMLGFPVQHSVFETLGLESKPRSSCLQGRH